jgi:hypothetical protein
MACFRPIQSRNSLFRGTTIIAALKKGHMNTYNIQVHGHTISAIDLFYPLADIRDWTTHFPDRSSLGYPTFRETHLFVASKKVPSFWFSEAFVSRHFDRLGYRTWSETYHLHKPPGTPLDKWSCSNPDLFQLLGESTVTRLQDAIASSGITPWANPDVIAFLPADGTWLFLECKLAKPALPEIGVLKSQDTLKKHQVESLLLLEQCVDNSRSIVVHVKPEEVDPNK